MPEKISIVKDTGESISSNIMSVFMIPENDKQYIITTENAVDPHGLTVLHVSEIEDDKLVKVKTDDEWASIKTIMRAIISNSVGSYVYIPLITEAKVEGQYSRDISVSAQAAKQLLESYTNGKKEVPIKNDVKKGINENAIESDSIFPTAPNINDEDNEIVPGIEEVDNPVEIEPTIDQPNLTVGSEEPAEDKINIPIIDETAVPAEGEAPVVDYPIVNEVVTNNLEPAPVDSNTEAVAPIEPIVQTEDQVTQVDSAMAGVQMENAPVEPITEEIPEDGTEGGGGVQAVAPVVEEVPVEEVPSVEPVDTTAIPVVGEQVVPVEATEVPPVEPVVPVETTEIPTAEIPPIATPEMPSVEPAMETQPVAEVPGMETTMEAQPVTEIPAADPASMVPETPLPTADVNAIPPVAEMPPVDVAAETPVVENPPIDMTTIPVAETPAIEGDKPKEPISLDNISVNVDTQAIADAINENVNAKIESTISAEVNKVLPESVGNVIEPAIERTMEPAITKNIEPALQKTMEPAIEKSLSKVVDEKLTAAIEAKLNEVMGKEIEEKVRAPLLEVVTNTVNETIERQSKALNSLGIKLDFGVESSFGKNATLDEIVAGSQELFVEGVKNLIMVMTERMYKELRIKEEELKRREVIVAQREQAVNDKTMAMMNGTYDPSAYAQPTAAPSVIPPTVQMPAAPAAPVTPAPVAPAAPAPVPVAVPAEDPALAVPAEAPATPQVEVPAADSPAIEIPAPDAPAVEAPAPTVAPGDEPAITIPGVAAPAPAPEVVVAEAVPADTTQA